MPTSPTATSKGRSRRTEQQPKQSIREQVYRCVRDAIRKGEITFDDKVLDYDVANRMGVSRMPVREALMQLKNEGILEGTSRGFVLRRFTPTDIANIFETRLLLEPAAAADACKNSSVEGLSRMQSMVSAGETALANDDVVAFMEASEGFRLAWVAMVPNPHLIETIDRLRDHMEAVRLATLRDKATRELALSHLKRILDAFLRADVDEVKERVAYNMRTSAACYYNTQAALMGGGRGATGTPPAPGLKLVRGEA